MVTNVRREERPDLFETTVVNLCFVRLESEPGYPVKKGATPKDSIIVVIHVDDWRC